MKSDGLCGKKYHYSPLKDAVNEHTYMYTGLSGGTVGALALILAALNIAIALLMYKVGLVVALFVLVSVRAERRQYRSAAGDAAVFCGWLSFALSAVIWIISVWIYGG